MSRSTPDAHDSPQNRGRRADKPTDIPAKGWKDIAWRLFKEVSDDRVLLISAGVTFYLLLALAPLLGAFVSVYGLILDPADIAAQAESLAKVIPGGAVDVLTDQLDRLASADTSTLGFAFAASLGIALWSANAGMKAMFEAMNIAYDETEHRSFIKLTLTTLAFTICVILTLVALIAINGVAATLFGDGPLAIVLPAVSALVALATLIAFMACLFRYGPCREEPRWKWITPGAVFAGILIVLVSIGFSFYVANFGSYNETYGSLGAIVGFLTWLWLVVVVLVMGGELNAEMEHQTSRDTTVGEPEPMGERGATVADEVGRRWGKEADA